jgi:hypothetical protein
VPEPDRPALRIHFESCDTCSAELARLDRVLRALGRLKKVEPSEDFTWRVRQAFLRAHPEFLTRPTPERYSFWSMLMQTFDYVPAWAVSVAGHVILVALLAIFLFSPENPETVRTEDAIQALPIKKPSDLPDFNPDRDPPQPGKGSDRPRNEWATPGDLPPNPGDPEFFITPPRYPPDKPGPGPVPDRLDPTRWWDRLPRDKHFLAFFRNRGAPDRILEVPEGADGGEVKASIGGALGWLASRQEEDGRWTGTNLLQEGAFGHDVALTGLALMAFLGDGHGPESEVHGETVAKGLHYLLGEQRSSGLLGPEEGNYMYNHGVAGVALVEASLMQDDPRLRTAATAAVTYAIMAQNRTGGWGYVARAGEDDTSVGGWQVLMLRLAKFSGYSGVIQPLDLAKRSIAGVTDDKGRVGYRRTGHFPNGVHALTAIGMVSHLMASPTLDGERMALQAGIVTSRKAVVGTTIEAYGENDLYLGLFGSIALYQLGGEAWKGWYPGLAGALVAAQGGDGAWPANFDRWSGHAGQVYTTATAALILETPGRYPRLFN